jgi:hypothetical protein
MPLGSPSCATVAQVTGASSDASLATICAGQSCRQKRAVHLGKMIASTWTRVADATAEGLTQKEPPPPRHSQARGFVPSHSLSNGISKGSTSTCLG